MTIFEYDKAENVQLLCGVDEAGRGPLAGDVYAGAVILPPDCIIEGLDDSKKLTPQKRDELYDIIIEKAVAYGVGIATIAEIDSVNILQATFLAMNRAVENLAVKPNLILVDGNQNPRLNIHSRCVIKGDSTSACIAAASIIAKVERDRYMCKVAEKYPQYQFEKHKGYGTTLHYEMLDENGISDVHRMSFLKKYLNGDVSISKKRGMIGEQTATDYLLQNGYEIIEKNYFSSYGELDIVAKIKDILVIVEVKARKSKGVATAKEAVTRSKQTKIIKTTAHYINKNGIKMQTRFDVFEVYFQGNSENVTEINHMINAFTGDDCNVFM